ncbi:MAG TPA: phosphoenolpyruvate--protein phosphotransferase [Alphaproteobacteria bacterium]
MTNEIFPHVEEILDGIGLCSGIAIGQGFLLERATLDVPHFSITTTDIDEEIGRFDAARHKAYNQIAKLQTKAETLPAKAAEDIILILEVHLSLVGESRLTEGIKQRITEKLINAEWAVEQEINELGNSFSAMEDVYLAGRVKDLQDVGQRLIRNLLERKFVALKSVPTGGIVLSEDITPADTAFMHPDRIGGFISLAGGRQSHTAIMARSLRLPAVAGIPHLPHHLHPDSIVIVDGIEGRVIVNPTEEVLTFYRQKQETDRLYQQKLLAKAHLPAITKDHVKVEVMANFSSPDDLERILASGAEGIGLVRTEYMFLNRSDLPTAQEQYDHLGTIVQAMHGQMVTIRTMDIGADKTSPAFQHIIAPEANPALGLRGLRLSLAAIELLQAQCAALWRVAALGPIRVLLPMVSTVEQIRQFRQIFFDVGENLRRQKVKVGTIDAIGIMVETPAVALIPDVFAKESDFFAIGTNDLVQYILAADRGNETVADYYQPGHPAVIRAFENIGAAAKSARIPVSICGELAGDPNFTEFLLRQGIRQLSMPAGNIPLIKERIRNLKLQEKD